jgi:hypothetical protein
MRPLSVEEQDRKLRAECPQFSLVAHASWIGVWDGTLTPICQTYRIRINYFSRRLFDGWSLQNPYVGVFVIDPPIGPDPRCTREPPQHVYRLGYPPAFPRLCIHDPVEDEWWPDEYIVDRIIPWTIKWLFFHEEWVATGEWKGGGRHPELPQPCLRNEGLDPDSRARPEQFRNAAFHSLGRKIGVFASSLLMEAASAASFPPLSWRDLSGASPAEIQLHLISTLLQVPRLGVYSPLAWVPGTRPPNFSTSTSVEDAKSSPLPRHCFRPPENVDQGQEAIQPSFLRSRCVDAPPHRQARGSSLRGIEIETMRSRVRGSIQ